MESHRNALVKGALCGGCAAVGLMFLLFWNMLFTSAQAGVLVNGTFRSYRDEPTGYILLAGGVVLLLVGLAALFWTWRGFARRAAR